MLVIVIKYVVIKITVNQRENAYLSLQTSAIFTNKQTNFTADEKNGNVDEEETVQSVGNDTCVQYPQQLLSL